MTPLIKEKKLSEKQEMFLDALITDAKGNIREAMRMAGYSDTTKIAEVVGPLKEQITEKASMVLAMNAPKAAFGIVGVLDDPSAMGARNSVAAAREILDRTGLVKKEQVEVTGVENGLFILPPKKIEIDEMGTEE
jgi:hypothetical protein|tara:strand:+ start:3351 stop:3755 length:405 start_codon:yes stop_codon:yes gene_type:complete